MKNAGRMRIETVAKWAAGKKTKERKKEREREREMHQNLRWCPFHSFLYSAPLCSSVTLTERNRDTL